MPIQNCPIDIPEGWEFVRYGNAEVDETVMDDLGFPHTTATGIGFPRIIIRRALPKLEVGDWVRVVHLGGHTDGKRGVVHGCPSSVSASYLVSIKGIGELSYQRDNLIKQTRTVKPYTIDQCIAEIAIRESRDVIRGGEPTEIVTISANGFYTEDGFCTYGEAAECVTWPNGDAFGVVKWEDAE